MKSENVRVIYSKKERAVQRALGTWSRTKEYEYVFRVKRIWLYIWLTICGIYLASVICAVIWDWSWKKSAFQSVWILPVHVIHAFAQSSKWFQHKYFGPPPREEECNENW